MKGHRREKKKKLLGCLATSQLGMDWQGQSNQFVATLSLSPLQLHWSAFLVFLQHYRFIWYVSIFFLISKFWTHFATIIKTIRSKQFWNLTVIFSHLTLWTHFSLLYIAQPFAMSSSHYNPHCCWKHVSRKRVSFFWFMLSISLACSWFSSLFFLWMF